MAAMKVTTSAAMRARDVSRPHAEHLAYAEEAEASAVSASGPASRRSADAAVPAGTPVAAGAAPGDEVLREARGGDRPGGGRRRWRSRGSGRRGSR